MDWREKSVTLGNVQKERFNTHLAHVTVSETRITVAYKDAEDWKRIRREVGTDILLEETVLDDVLDVDTSEEHLYYPHINLTVATDDGREEKRIYFMEDEMDDLAACLKAIRRFWNAQRQRGAPHRDSYRYGEERGEGAEAAEEGEGDTEADAEPDTGTAEDEAGSAGETEEQEEVELTAALKQQNSLTHRLSEGIKNEAAHFKELLTGGDDAEETEAEQEAEDDTEADEAEKKGVTERISDEVRSEIDRFRHIGEDGEKKEEEDDDVEDEEDTDEEGDTDEADEDDDAEDQEEKQSPVEDVVDRFMGQ